MAFLPEIPFQPKQEQDPNNRKRRRSVYDDVQDVKKMYDNIRKYGKLLTNPGVIVFLIILGVILLFLLPPSGSFLGGGSSAPSVEAPKGGKPTVPSIPGFDINIEGPVEIANGIDLEYTVSISHDPTIAPPIENIELFDTLSPGSDFINTTGKVRDPKENPRTWPLSETANQNTFKIVVRPNVIDTRAYDYTISARHIVSGSSSGNACTEPYEGVGYCSVSNLAPTFGGDQGKALVASMICQAESRSNPMALNTRCDPGVAEDYSVGLFQINLTVHCPGAYANSDCTQLLSESKRGVCESTLKDPLSNIQKMFALSAGTYWTPWSTWPGVKSKIESCGIL